VLYYIGRRLIAMVVLLFFLTFITFVMFHFLPTDPARLTCGKACTPQVIAANRIRLGLNDPWWIQYWDFLKAIFVGRTFGSGTATFPCNAPCLGYDFRNGVAVTTELGKGFPATASLAVGGFILWMVVGVLLGIYAALRRGRWQDKAANAFALIGYSFPSFFIGLMLIYFVIFKFHLMQYPTYQALTVNPHAWFMALILPWVTLATLYAAFYVRLTRNQMLETLGEDYIRTARAKGLSERTVIFKHGLRAGLTPIVTAAGLDLAGLLGGVVIVEQLFNIPGIGRLAVLSVVDANLPVIVAIVLISAFFVIIGNLIVDILYAVIDPRVRLS
jgi:peptide/nickel transport system permease protein